MQTPIDLNQAQTLAWLHQGPVPATSREALGRLSETLRQGVDAFDQGQLIACQSALEDTLLQTLIAMRAFDLQPEAALQRALNRLQHSGEQRAFHLFADRVEIWAQGELRGEWPLYSQADYDAALRLGRELGCEVIDRDTRQLELFRHDRTRRAAGSPE